MSFFGILASLFTIGALTVDGVKNSSFDSGKQYEAKQENIPTWFDSRGNRRSTLTGNIVYTDYKGRLVDSKTNRVIYDVNLVRSNNINREVREEALKNGRKYARLMYPDYNNKYYYTELSTGKRYWLYGYRDRVSGRGSFEKIYYESGQEHSYQTFDKNERIPISFDEYMELGGYDFQKGIRCIGD
jgi:hypothetical protein